MQVFKKLFGRKQTAKIPELTSVRIVNKQKGWVSYASIYPGEEVELLPGEEIDTDWPDKKETFV